MIGIQIQVEISNDLVAGALAEGASDWMFGPVERFWHKAMLYTPVWTGALQSSVAMDELGDGSGYEVTAGDPDILNPITGTPTSDYAPYQEADKQFMAEAFTISGVQQKLAEAAAEALGR